jgi:hypothetical protein
MKRPLTTALILFAATLTAHAEETIVGSLLSSQLTVYEQAQKSVLDAVVRVQDGSYVIVTCEINDSGAQAAAGLREANVVMQAYIASGSRTTVEVIGEKSASPTGLHRYVMKSWDMPIPGLDDYQFVCGEK